MTQIKRSQGRSVVAAAAYRAAECLTSEYDGIVSDFTRKRGVLHSEILLPSHAPPEFADRGTLWNAVEKIEKRRNAQLAHSFDIALQAEFSFEENLELVRRFLQENFVSRGMIVDFSIHDPDNGNGIRNPHFHVLCPIRPLNPDGTWGQKQHKETGEDGHEKFVSNTDWGDKQTLMVWRQAWADINNATFAEKGLPQRIDCRSYEEQGLQLLPTVHEGPAVREMEARGVRTNKGSLNRWIRATNALIRKLISRLGELKGWITDRRDIIREEKDEYLIDLLSEYYNNRKLVSMARGYRPTNRREQMEELQLTAFLISNNLHTTEQLEEKIDSLTSTAKEIRAKVRAVDIKIKRTGEAVRHIQTMMELKPMMEEFAQIRFKGRREKFKTEHAEDFRRYYAARGRLKKIMGEDLRASKKAIRSLEQRLEQLDDERETLSEQLEPLEDESRKLNDIRWKIDKALADRGKTIEEMAAGRKKNEPVR